MSESSERKRESFLKGLAWPLCALAAFCVLCVCGATVYAVKTASSAAVSMMRGDVSSSFSSYTLGVRGKAELALCSAKRVELLKMSVPNRFSYSEITVIVPVECNYFVDMKGSWSLVASNGVLKVVAPPLDVLPPAADLQGTQVIVDKSVFDFGRAQEKLDGLKAQAASRLKARALAPEALKEVRETARAELAAFVWGWLASGVKGKIDSVLVRFADEPEFPGLGFARNPKL